MPATCLTFVGNLPTERIKKIFEDSKNIGEKVNQPKESIEAESEKKDEEGKEGDKYVVIDGHRLEKDKTYVFHFTDNGEISQTRTTPGAFRDKVLSRKGIILRGIE